MPVEVNVEKTWIEQMCEECMAIEKQTHDVLGPQADFFENVLFEWDDVYCAVAREMNGEHDYNLVTHTLVGLNKEIRWLHFFFLAGNYPLVMSRMRFVWENVFRAYFAENYPMGLAGQGFPNPGATLDDKMKWIGQFGGRFNWNTCLQPVLLRLFPLAQKEEECRTFYHDHLKLLHQYVHPSAHLADRMIDPSRLHVADNFDEKWAKDTLVTGSIVFDLVWLAILSHHDTPFENLSMTYADYPIMSLALAPKPESSVPVV